MTANDKYRRDSLDGGTTWGEPYQFKGTDGKNGSNASVPQYIKQTYIDSVEIRSPTIKANEYFIYPIDESDYTGSFNIFGATSGVGKQYHMFQIKYDGEYDSPIVRLSSPGGASVYIGGDSNKTYFDGNLDFSTARNIYWGTNAPTAVFG